MQRPLLPPEPRTSLVWGPGHYVPALLYRPGELTALSNASLLTWAGFTPLVSLVGPKKNKEALTADCVRGWIKRIAETVAEHPFYLDTLRFKPERCVKISAERKGAPALEFAYEQARKRQLNFVPVIKVSNTSAKIYEIVSDAVWQNGLGVALRYQINNTALPSGTTHSTLLEETLKPVELEPSSADLILDLEYLSPEDDIRDDDLSFLIDYVAQMNWRNIILLATGMPSKLSCVSEGTLGEIDRPEWNLWQALSQAKIDRMPTYGDYAIQHPTPPQDGGPGMRANIRYTAEEKTLVARGEGALLRKGEGSVP